MWIVLTGAPSSGKTTLLDLLAAQGLPVMGESAREVLEQGGLDESTSEVQRLIELRQIEKESALQPGVRTVLDRALPDSLAYRRLVGMEEADLRALVNPRRYAMVFLCAFGRHVDDGVRKPDVGRAIQIEDHLRSIYTELGCPLVELPWEGNLPLTQGIGRRLAMITERLRAGG